MSIKEPCWLSSEVMRLSCFIFLCLFRSLIWKTQTILSLATPTSSCGRCSLARWEIYSPKRVLGLPDVSSRLYRHLPREMTGRLPLLSSSLAHPLVPVFEKGNYSPSVSPQRSNVYSLVCVYWLISDRSRCIDRVTCPLSQMCLQMVCTSWHTNTSSTFSHLRVKGECGCSEDRTSYICTATGAKNDLYLQSVLFLEVIFVSLFQCHSS